MWNPLTGKIKNVFEDPMKNEITALTLDRNMKRTFLGDNTGQIKCFNMKNGKFLKSLTSHSLEINMLIHSLSLNIVVSCSVDNVVKIHDDTELLETSVIKVINIYGNQVKCISIMELMYQGENEEEDVSRLVFGLSNGVIKFYDIEHFRYDSDIITDVANLNDDATCIHVFNNHPVVFSCHNTGTCKFMWTPPSVSKFRDFYSFKNVDAKNATNYVPVTCLDFDQVNQRMFCGDQLGVIKCYSFNEIFSIIEEFNINKDEKLCKIYFYSYSHSKI
jgi:WD40 repeat protein